MKVKYHSFNCDVNNYKKMKSFISNLKKLDILVKQIFLNHFKSKKKINGNIVKC